MEKNQKLLLLIRDYYLLLPLRNLKKEYYIIFVFESWQTCEFWHTAAAYVRLD